MDKKMSRIEQLQMRVHAAIAWVLALVTMCEAAVSGKWREFQSATTVFAKLSAALMLAFSVVAVIIVSILAGFGLVILYAVQNTASTAGNLSSAQQTSVGNFFTNLIGSYGLMPLVVLVMIVGLVIASFFLFIPRSGGGGEV